MAQRVERLVQMLPTMMLRVVLGSLVLGVMTLVGCGKEDWKCAPPSDSIAVSGTFDLNFIGETALFASDAMQVRVIPLGDDAIDVWACQKRGAELWNAEVSVTRPSAITLPANFGRSGTSPNVSAWMTRYDEYRVLEEQLGDGLNAQVLGTLDTMDLPQGMLVFDATLSQPCTSLQCQADQRELVINANFAWTPR